MISAIRSWQQIHRLETSRKGLIKIVEASNQFIAHQGIYSFAEGVITQMAGLFNLEPDGVVCAVAQDSDCTDQNSECRIIAAAGDYKYLMDHRIQDIKERKIVQALSIAMHQKTNLLEKESLTVFFEEPSGATRFAIWIASASPLGELDQHLLEVFCSNLALSAANVELVGKLKRQAWEDPLLEIPNLSALLQKITENQNQNLKEYQQLVLLDIDGFGQINEMLGHEYADKVLKSLSEKLQAYYGSDVYFARVAANTFGILGRQDEFSQQRLKEITAVDVPTNNGTMELSISIGICSLETDDAKGHNALHNGYIALKRAKHQGRGQVVTYSRHIGEETRDRLILLQMLKTAFNENQLHLVYQPQLELPELTVLSCEALLRWKTGQDFIPPDRFIPLAEQSGLIVPIGIWVIRRALRGLQEIHAAGYPHLKIAVNISAMQFQHKDFIGDLDRALEEVGMDPRFLELEITESISIMGIRNTLDLLKEIKSRGITLAVDDFGTGYSSLSTIEQWPVDRIKIDKTFIDQMESREEGHSLVDLVIPICRNLSLTILAEGVETAEQLERLTRSGCDEAQGFYLGKPMTLQNLISWLKKGADHEEI